METAKDSDYFKETFHKHHYALCNYAAQFINDSVVAKDILQNLFLELWEKRKLKEVKNVERYLLRCTKFKCIDYLKTKDVKNKIGNRFYCRA